ncbi:LysR family transcriptional regulator [Shimia abyssi]|nr:LysR family transcriptional regulator [Shimia abyssi]
MADWEDLKTVLHLVRAGSLAGAGAALGVNYTTVARRISRIEKDMDVRLFDRLADGYQATEVGKSVALRAAEMEAQELTLMRTLQGRDQLLSGTLVVTAPQLMIGPYISPVAAQFFKAHPNVELRLKASNDIVDLTRREADLAVRISRSPGDTLKGVRVAGQQTACFGARKWLDRTKNDVIDWVVYEQQPEVPVAAKRHFPKSRVVLVCDDMAAMVGAAVAGLGVVRMPFFLGRATPGLVQLPFLDSQPYADVWVLSHPDVWPSARVAAFREMLVPFFRSRRADFLN